jgi:hypothetical protein
MMTSFTFRDTFKVVTCSPLLTLSIRLQSVSNPEPQDFGSNGFLSFWRIIAMLLKPEHPSTNRKSGITQNILLFNQLNSFVKSLAEVIKVICQIAFRDQKSGGQSHRNPRLIPIPVESQSRRQRRSPR